MDQQEITEIRQLMDYEGRRKGPPEGFPKFPDMPAGRYVSEEFYELENEFYWTDQWLFVAHMDELPEVGSYKLWDMIGEPLVIVHGKDGKPRAFYNTCRHRGAPVVTEEYGQGRGGLSCGYHGWTYDYEGNLKNIRDRRDFVDFDMSCRGLYPVRTEMFGKLIFVNFNDEAKPLRESMGPVADQLEEFDFANSRLVDRYVWDLKCNWKIAMEANMEVYHVKSIHPETVDSSLDYRGNVNTLYPGGHSRMVSPTRPEALEAMKKKADPNLPDIESVGEIGRTCTQSYHIEPNWVSPVGPGPFPVLLFWPSSIRETKYEIWWFAADWGAGDVPEAWKNHIDWFNVVITEDTQFGDWIQKSVESRAFKGVPLCYQEARIYHAHEAIDRAIGINRIPEHLRVEQVLGDEWVWPNDDRRRLEEYQSMKAAAE